MGYQERWRRTGIAGLAAVTMVAAAPGPAAAKGGNRYAALSADYSQGDFDTSVDNELYTLRPEVGYVTEDYDWSASIPLHYLRVIGNGSATETGIGDALLRAGHYLWRDEPRRLSLHGALAIKLATGDEDKGLGTGATDLTGTMSLRRKAGPYVWTLLTGYTQVGEPSGVDYDNTVFYSVGVNHSFTRTNLFASLNGQTSVVPGSDAPLELDVGFFRLLSAEHVIIAHTFVGMSGGSPDGGAGVAWVRWF